MAGVLKTIVGGGRDAEAGECLDLPASSPLLVLSVVSRDLGRETPGSRSERCAPANEGLIYSPGEFTVPDEDLFKLPDSLR